MSWSGLIAALKGGTGSGNFNHTGRPGKIGGSAQGGVRYSVKNGPELVTDTPPDYFDAIISAAGADNLDVVVQTARGSKVAKNHRRGYYSDEEKKIVVFDWSYVGNKEIKLTSEQRAWVLAHELGHYDHHSKGLDIPHKPDRERYAEAYAQELIGRVIPDKLSSLSKWRKQTFDPASGRYLD